MYRSAYPRGRTLITIPPGQFIAGRMRGRARRMRSDPIYRVRGEGGGRTGEGLLLKTTSI